jgi:hypothetical protein
MTDWRLPEERYRTRAFRSRGAGARQSPGEPSRQLAPEKTPAWPDLMHLLVNVLNIVEEDRDIDAAVDELSEAAAAYLEALAPKMKSSKGTLQGG